MTARFAAVTAATLICLLDGTGAAADKIRVAYSAVAPTQGVLWVAEMGGLFSKNGLSAELVYTRAAIETLIAGEVEFGQMTGALMFSARLQGADDARRSAGYPERPARRPSEY